MEARFLNSFQNFPEILCNRLNESFVLLFCLVIIISLNFWSQSDGNNQKNQGWQSTSHKGVAWVIVLGQDCGLKRARDASKCQAQPRECLQLLTSIIREPSRLYNHDGVNNDVHGRNRARHNRQKHSCDNFIVPRVE